MPKYIYDEGYNTRRVNPISLNHLRKIFKDGGMRELIKRGLRYSKEKLTIFLEILNHSLIHTHYIVNGNRYRYWTKLSRYSFSTNSLLGERVIEVSFVKQYIANGAYCDILEVGCVLPQYVDFGHDVVDKYEVGKDVINEDIVDFHPNKKYDLIVSVSTIEHIGFDEKIKEKGKSQKAILRIRDLLKEGGMALITVPLGYNPEIDDLVLSGDSIFKKRIFMKRISRLNSWKQVTEEEPIVSYGSHFRNVNSLAILEVHRSES